MPKVLKSVLKGAGIVIRAVLIFAVVFIGYLSITEYNPGEVEPLEIAGEGTKSLSLGESVKFISFNIGYGGLGKDADFFMDGGKNVVTGDEALVYENLGGIKKIIESSGADFALLQEVDVNSSRTFGINEAEFLTEGQSVSFAHALNYSCNYVPFPFPPIGRVNSGLLTLSASEMESAERYALPCPFSWPVRVANLKRCILVSYHDIEGTDAKLAVINLHLEAYDDGEGKTAQTKMLVEIMENEYKKGNYVVAGGDFNQSFADALELYPVQGEGYWTPGTLESDSLPEGWSFVYDLSSPTCRSLDRPLDSSDENFQYYFIDGFIVSPNVEVISVNTLDGGFIYSDHNPVTMEIKLK